MLQKRVSKTGVLYLSDLPKTLNLGYNGVIRISCCYKDKKKLVCDFKKKLTKKNRSFLITYFLYVNKLKKSESFSLETSREDNVALKKENRSSSMLSDEEKLNTGDEANELLGYVSKHFMHKHKSKPKIKVDIREGNPLNFH